MDHEDKLHAALLLHRDGDTGAAETLYRELVADDPAHAAANLNLAAIALERDQLDDAAARLQGVIARDEDDGVAHLLYSRALFRMGRHTDGYHHIRAAFEQLPEDDGVANEYVSAMRRQSYHFDGDAFSAMIESARSGNLPEADRQRLAQLALFRILRPELLRLLVQPGLPQGAPDAVSRWLAELPEGPRADLALLARNFAQAVELMHSGTLFAPVPAALHLRAGEEGEAEERRVGTLEDADTLTAATLEIVSDGALHFVPFANIRSVEFSEPAAATGVVVTLRDGTLISGLMPLFYLFTEFAEAEAVRRGQSTLVRPIVPGAAAGVGLRVLRADDGFVPVVRIERIEFEDRP